MPTPDQTTPELSQHLRSVLSKFLTDTEVSIARMRDVIRSDYDSRIVRFYSNEHEYYLIESDHIETDAIYQSIAQIHGQTIVRKVPMRAEIIPPYPQKIPGMKHDFADSRDEWAFVYGDGKSHLLYCLFEAD